MKTKLEQRSITIDILAKELEAKEIRVSRMREKMLEQQEHLKYKIRRIDELKEEIEKWKLAQKYSELPEVKEFFKKSVKQKKKSNGKDRWKN